jgi:hypothetical protein
MPTSNRRENTLISMFLSAYDDDAWRDCIKAPLDEKEDGAVEILATRPSDGATLAIEHTLIQPFVLHKQEFARLRETFLPIQDDKSLIVPGRATDVFIPAGILGKKGNWKSQSEAVQKWLQCNISSLPEGESRHSVRVDRNTEFSLLIRVVAIPGYGGTLTIGIDGSQLPDGSLGAVVKKALKMKLPKLISTEADRRILLLERDEFTLPESAIHKEIEKRRRMSSDLGKVNEIWFAETVFFHSAEYVRFSLISSGVETRALAFHRGQLITRS